MAFSATGQLFTQPRHGFGQHSLASAHPQRPRCAGYQKPRRVAFAAAVAFFGDGPRVIVGLAIARLAVGRADAVTILRDLDGGPVHFGQRGDDAGDDAGFAYAARVSADHDDCHDAYFSCSCAVSRDRVANSFRYSRTGFTGVPQKITPLPRNVLLGSTPLCPPRIAPCSRCAWSPMPTCPPSTQSSPTLQLPEMPVCAAMTVFAPIAQLWPMCTRLSNFVPGPMTVSSSAPRSMVQLAPIST